jgi:hypothetical protein
MYFAIAFRSHLWLRLPGSDGFVKENLEPDGSFFIGVSKPLWSQFCGLLPKSA